MKKNYFFIISSGFIIYSILFTGITNGQIDGSTYTSRSCKTYTIEYVDSLQAYTSPNLKKQEYFINTDYFKRYVDSKNQQLPNCPTNGSESLSSYTDNSSSQDRFTAPNGKIYFITQQGGEYTSDGLSNQKKFKTVDELKNYIKSRNPLAILTNQNNSIPTNQQTTNQNSNTQQHTSANTQNQYNQNQNQYNQSSRTGTSSQATNQTYTTQYAYCSGLPQNAYRVNNKFTQTYYGDGRYPINRNATYSQDNSVECSFDCIYNYTRNYYSNKCESKNNEDIELLKNIKDLIYSESSNNTSGNSSKSCKSGYVKIDGECVKEVRTKGCIGLPNNAKWINDEFEQYRDGDERYPNKITPVYSKDDETECSFVCEKNYERNKSTKKCKKKSSGGGGGGGGSNGSQNTPTTYSCFGTFANAFLITGSDTQLTENTISKLYDDIESAGNNKCAYVCNNHYHSNSTHQTCEPNTQQANCTGYVVNSQWINSHFTQTRSGDSRYPASKENTYTGNNNIECSFICESNYERKNGKCEGSSNPGGNPGGGDNPSNPTTYSCSGTFTNAFLITGSDTQLTENTISRLYDDIESAGNNKCAYVCNNHYHASSLYQECDPDNRTEKCPENKLPNNSQWVNSGFTQTRNGSTWAPSTFQRDYESQHTYNSAADCAYHCDINYQLVSKGNGKYECEECKEGEYYVGGHCEQYTCNENKPNHTTLITGSDTGLTSNNDTVSKLCYTKGNKLVYKDKNNNEVDCDTNVKCAYICNEYYEYENGTCIAKVNANEYCGEKYKSVDDNSIYTLEVLVSYDKQPGLCKTGFYVGELPKHFVTDNGRTNPLYRDDDIKHYYDTRTWRCYYSGDNNIYSTSCHAKKTRAKCGGAAIENTETNDGSLCSKGEAGNLYNNVGSHVIGGNPNPENLEDLPEGTKLKERTCGFNEGSVGTQRGSVECHIKPDICGNAKDYHFLNTPTDTTTSDGMKIYLCGDGSKVQIITGNGQAIETKDRSILSGEISETDEGWIRTCATKFESASCSAKKPVAKCGVNSYQHNPNQAGYITKPGGTDGVGLCSDRNLLSSNVTENYGEGWWEWQCSANGLDGKTFTGCSAKMGGCENTPMNSSGLNKSTDIYTGNERLTREYVELSDYNENDICKWTCSEGYTRIGNNNYCTPTGGEINESSAECGNATKQPYVDTPSEDLLCLAGSNPIGTIISTQPAGGYSQRFWNRNCKRGNDTKDCETTKATAVCGHASKIKRVETPHELSPNDFYLCGFGGENSEVSEDFENLQYTRSCTASGVDQIDTKECNAKMGGCSWGNTEILNYEGMLTGSDIYPGGNGKKLRTYTGSSTPGICEWTCNEGYTRKNNNNYCTVQ